MSKRSLSKVQKLAVEAFGRPVLIFAGAGSGKTRVLTHKIAHLIKKNLVPAENILAVTFTNKAAQEMRKRVNKLVKRNNGFLNIGTFHSTCARILRQEIHHLGYTSDFSIFDVQDQVALVKVVLESMDIPKNYVTPQEVRHKISYFKNKLIHPDEAKKKAHLVIEKTYVDIYAKYQKALAKNNAVDFDDLLLLPIEIFEKHPKILEKYRQKWQYILVDEYQDTNKPQFMLVKYLAQKHQQICVVGDDDQSIYGWRGADIRNILDFEKNFGNCEVFKLEKNYRSSRQILEAAASVVKNNENRAPKELVSHNGAGEKLGLIETNDEMEEADAVVNALEKEIKLQKRNFSDFAILYRTNSQSRALEDAFRRSGIPYNIVGGIRFYERKEIKDLIGYLSLIVNLKDTISLRRVINFPPRGIGMKTVDKCVIQAEKKHTEMIEVLNFPAEMGIRGKQADSLTTFYSVIKKYNELLPKLNAGELVRTLVEEAGIKQYYRNSSAPEDQERFDNVMEFLHSVDDFMARCPDGSLSQFLEEVSLLTDLDQWNDETNRVTLMTLHASKGLEFPVVFITGLEDGLFPIYSALEAKEKLEEERRLFYVGLTRAMDKVYLMYANHRRRIGSDELYGMVSRFVYEMPEEKLEKISFTSALTRKVVGGYPGHHTKTAVSRTVVIFDDFRVGDYVEHAIFGIGKVMALSGQGENQRVGIVFKDGLKKKLVVKFANLKKVESPEA
ncbi:MAG: UvrD-helicase domain-containing protein [Candidatus Marinimicrobia bacterium]|jgi:DNA helicase-2/ATP-dependent DNA helicase PcrA|nr:UvrD-helicase domain-containing protein [Candidatus Neomarinimicrobiota bacterium]MDP6610943.1 UvrD-helicase domain-containing protein [Candidatus Neomarinimicrobiota bacterium]|tara:strand:+ start:1515 stop:3698 length:2184 start_codon:yes stop_codon:yes gene_type:complete